MSLNYRHVMRRQDAARVGAQSAAGARYLLPASGTKRLFSRCIGRMRCQWHQLCIKQPSGLLYIKPVVPFRALARIRQYLVDCLYAGTAARTYC